MKKFIKKVKEVTEKLDWTMTIEGKEFLFSKYSPAGQDFNISIEAGNLEEIIEGLKAYCYNFDCSEETYLYLDNSGHGISGAPYDMKDLYEDMEACLEMAEELRDKIEDIEI